MKLSDNLIDYTLPTSKPASTASVAGKIFDGKNQFWELEEGDEPSKLVNAIEIDWNGANWSTIPTENVTIPQTIRTTSDLLIAIRNNHIAVTSQATQPVATTSKVIANITTDGYGHVTSSNDITMGNLASSLKTELDKMYEAKQFRQINFSYEQATSYIDDLSYGIINITTSVVCDSFEFDNLEDAAYYGYAWECEFERGDNGLSHQIKIWNLSYDLGEYVIPANTIQGHAIASDSAYVDSPVKVVQPRQIILKPKTCIVKYYKTYEHGDNLELMEGKPFDTAEYTYGEYIYLKAQNRTIANYSPNGWTTTVGGEREYKSSQGMTITTNLDLYEAWKPDTYQVTLDIEHATISDTNPQTIQRNKQASWHVTPEEGYSLPTTVTNGTINTITGLVTSNKVKNAITVSGQCNRIQGNGSYYYYIGWEEPTFDNEYTTVTNITDLINKTYPNAYYATTHYNAGMISRVQSTFSIQDSITIKSSDELAADEQIILENWYCIMPANQALYSYTNSNVELMNYFDLDNVKTVTISNVEHKVYKSLNPQYTLGGFLIK